MGFKCHFLSMLSRSEHHVLICSRAPHLNFLIFAKFLFFGSGFRVSHPGFLGTTRNYISCSKDMVYARINFLGNCFEFTNHTVEEYESSDWKSSGWIVFRIGRSSGAYRASWDWWGYRNCFYICCWKMLRCAWTTKVNWESWGRRQRLGSPIAARRKSGQDHNPNVDVFAEETKALA